MDGGLFRAALILILLLSVYQSFRTWSNFDLAAFWRRVKLGVNFRDQAGWP